MSITNPIPTIILTGFLGAGKTSYLNKLINNGIPDNSLILVNDFGSIDIDSDLIQYSNEHIIKLNNGCICCTLGGTLAEQLAELLRLEPYPAAIYIEASGIANPSRIIDMITVSSKLILRETVCLVDVSQSSRYSLDPLVNEVWQQQILAATHISLNRFPAKQNIPPELALLLNKSSANIEYLKTDHAVKNDKPYRSTKIARANTTGKSWQTFSIKIEHPIEGEGLVSILQAHNDILYRAKGILLRKGEDRLNIFQLSGDKFQWSPTSKTRVECKLVCIGVKGERFSKLEQSLTKFIARTNNSSTRYPS